MMRAKIWLGPCLTLLGLSGTAGAAGDVVFESLSPGGAQPQWIKDLNSLSEAERKSRVQNYRAPEPVKPARVAAGVMKREEASPQGPVRSPVVAPESPAVERAQVRAVPLSELQLPAPIQRATPQPAVAEPAPAPPVAAEKRKRGTSVRAEEPVAEKVSRAEPEVANVARPEAREEEEGDEARRSRWRGVFRKPAPAVDSQVAAPREPVKQMAPDPGRRAGKEERKTAKEAKANKPPEEPAETRSGRYQVRLSGPSRSIDVPVDENMPKPSKTEQEKAAALDAADYDGGGSGGSRKLFGRRTKKDDADADAVAGEPKPRRGLFRGRKGNGGLVARGGGVIETTLFGD